jgi:nicotinamidase-related amidase
VLATEQYPKGLGPTIPELVGRLPERAEKLTFSCCGIPPLMPVLREQGVNQILLAGIEAHVCVMQTALDLYSHAFRVYVAADAVGSRGATDREVALHRMEAAGVVLTTAEAAIFEWTQEAGTPQFKQISKLIQTPDNELFS